MMSINEHDQRLIRCRMLGHDLNFGYCREGVGELPCRRIFDCWFEQFDVESFMREHYTKEQIEKILTPPKPKMASLIELIQQANKNVRKAD